MRRFLGQCVSTVCVTPDVYGNMSTDYGNPCLAPDVASNQACYPTGVPSGDAAAPSYATPGGAGYTLASAGQSILNWINGLTGGQHYNSAQGTPTTAATSSYAANNPPASSGAASSGGASSGGTSSGGLLSNPAVLIGGGAVVLLMFGALLARR